MRPARVVIAVLLALVGAVWTLQGLGLIAGTAMSGTLFWAGAGIALIVGAGAVRPVVTLVPAADRDRRARAPRREGEDRATDDHVLP